jgi:hypothetical protein
MAAHNKTHSRILHSGLDVLQPVLVRLAVRIGQGDDPPFCCTQPSIACSVCAWPLLAQQLDARMLPHNLRRAIGGVVVHHDDFVLALEVRLFQ